MVEKIDMHGLTRMRGWIRIYFSKSSEKPKDPTLSYEIGNLGSNDNVYVGFIASTSAAYEIDDIIS